LKPDSGVTKKNQNGILGVRPRTLKAHDNVAGGAGGPR
jgi:hypothetical protein